MSETSEIVATTTRDGSRVMLRRANGRLVNKNGQQLLAMDASLDLSSVLDECHARISSGEYRDGMELLVSSLRVARRRTDPVKWQEYVDGVLLTHPVRNLVHQCPFTQHAFAKPRGYPGDAILLDHIYGLAVEGTVPNEPIPSGVYGYTTNSPAPRAVRYRRQFIADMVHEALIANARPRILAIAAGHLREAALVKPTVSSFEWIALDQDADSLKRVTEDYAHMGVKAVPQNIRNFITGRSKLGKFDLIYAAGLYDYLDDDVARRLLSAMIAAANPGAKVMIANFMPDIADIGYMESYMAWRLLYRSPEELAALVASIDQTVIEDVNISTDPDKNIAFAVLKICDMPKTPVTSSSRHT